MWAAGTSSRCKAGLIAWIYGVIRDGDAALAVVMDYKSGGKKLDVLLIEHGVQLQLLAYLNALRHWENPRQFFGVEKLVPAGVFYVNLRGQFESGRTRDEVLGEAGAGKSPYRHNGRFDAGALDKLDSRHARDQFNYRLTDAGKFTPTPPRPCRARNLKRCSTASKPGCGKWAAPFIPARRK